MYLYRNMPIDTGFGISFKSVGKKISKAGKGISRGARKAAAAAGKGVTLTTRGRIAEAWQQRKELGAGAKQTVVGATVIATEPLYQMEKEAALRLVPPNLRRYIPKPVTDTQDIVRKGKAAAEERYRTLRTTTAKPLYQLVGKYFGKKTAAMVMAPNIKAEDVGIKRGSKEAAEFYQYQRQGRDIGMSIVGTAIPVVGIAWAVYRAGETYSEQERAKHLAEKRMSQEKKMVKLQERKQQAEVKQQLAELETIERQIAELNGEIEGTENEIYIMADEQEREAIDKNDGTISEAGVVQVKPKADTGGKLALAVGGIAALWLASKGI